MTAAARVPVFKLRFTEGHEWLLPVDEGDFDKLRFDGSPRFHTWKPVRMRRVVRSHDGVPLRPSDFPACSGGDMLILSRFAKETLEKSISSCGELLPLACKDGEFFALNVTAFSDALDLSASQSMKASESGDILLIKRHVFRAEAIPSAGVFKLPQTPRGLIYATQSFANAIERSGLKGLCLELL